MSHPKNSVAPETPEQSSNPWALGFTYWWRVINDWIRLLSPAGVNRYDTDWVTIPLASGFSAHGAIPPQVRRVGRELRYRGMVKRTNGADFTPNARSTIAAPGAITDDSLRPLAEEYHGIVGNGAPMVNGGRLVITPLGELSIDVGSYGGPYYSLFGVRSSVD